MMTKETKVGLIVGLVFIVGVVYLLQWFAQPSQLEEQVNQYKAQQRQTASREVNGGRRIPLSMVDKTPLLLTDKKVPGKRVTVPAKLRIKAPEPGKAVVGSIRKSVLPVKPVVVKKVKAAGPRFYVVRAGQTLGDVAEAVYGAGHRQEFGRIHEANKYKVPNKNVIWPGLKLKIPPLEKSKAADVKKVPGLLVSRSYTVQSGDTLSEIAAKKLGSSGRADEIFRLNRDKLSDEDTIYPGMVLKLPAVRRSSGMHLPKSTSELLW